MKRAVLIFMLLVCAPIMAEDQRFPFSSPEQAERFRQLTEELRCVVCQNQSLADSDAELANDLRQVVYDLMAAAQSDDQITEHLVSRYGEFVLYRPRLTPATYVLWFAPLGLLLVGLVVLLLISRRRLDKNTVSEAQLEKAKKLLEGSE